jgi:two-component system, OmpR family, response regulator MtrA
MLEAEGFEVDEAPSGEVGITLFDRMAADVALVDVMLPAMSGFDTCVALRERSDLPIVIISARDSTADVVKGLESGADDYVTKPFVPEELLARIKAHLRRRSDKGVKAFRVGDLEVVPHEGVVRHRSGEEVHLTSTEFKLICDLAAADGKVVTREDLLERVWGYDYFGDTRLVDVHIRRLRTKIEPDPANPTYLVTVRGTGYKLVL